MKQLSILSQIHMNMAKLYKLRLFLLWFTLAFFGSTSCNSQKHTPETYEKRQITIGSGGGFTGFVTAYTFLENGQVFKMESQKKTYEALEKAPKKEIKNALKKLDSINIKHSEFKHPGNMYKFIELKEDDQSYRITWGDNKHPVPPDVQTLYDHLMTLVQPSKE